MDDGSIAFVLINPLLFKPDYTIEVTEAEVSDLELSTEEDAVISVIITMPTNPQNMTANLKAPLVFNLKNRKGKQIILNQPGLTTRHNIMEEMRKHSDSLKDRDVVKKSMEKVREQSEGSRASSQLK